jgi:cation:H+ antiporter
MLAVMFGFYFVARDGTISSGDGALLVLSLVGFLIFLVLDARRHGRQYGSADVVVSDVLLPTWKKVTFLLGGMIMLTVGAKLMVDGATAIATDLGISPIVVGLTVVAIGTSLPELAASLMCALRQEADMSVGNVLGSNLLNVLFVVGLVALVRPLQVDNTSIEVHFPVMLAFSVILLPIARTQYQITRWEGGMLLAGFIAYMYYLILPYV